MKKLTSLFVVTILLAGCLSSTEVRTVEWYKEHPTERKAQLVKCRAEGKPDEAAVKNCKNAETAAVQALAGPGSLRIK